MLECGWSGWRPGFGAHAGHDGRVVAEVYFCGRTAPQGRPRGALEPTFRLVTRSAVSRRVNWLIWSTMAEIFGLALAASVDSCLRWTKTAEDLKELRLARSERAQLRAAILQGADMIAEGVSRSVPGVEVPEFAIPGEVVDFGGSSRVVRDGPSKVFGSSS